MAEVSVYQGSITANRRSQGFFGQFWGVLLQPVSFFKRLDTITSTSQWISVGLLILLLTGISAVQQDKSINGVQNDSSTEVDGGEPISDPFMGGPIGGPPPGEIPGDQTSSTTSGADASETWGTGLLAAGILVLQWLGLAVVLSEVSLLRGKRPQLGKNMQIAVWASLPLGLMAALQLIYFAMGGTYGQAGLSGLLLEWKAYMDFSELQQNILLALTRHLTIFWLWSLLLIYLGARFTLNGRRWVSWLAVVIWLAVLILVPVFAGQVDAEAFIEENTAATADDQVDEMPPMEEMPFMEGEGMPPSDSEGRPFDENDPSTEMESGVPTDGEISRPEVKQ